MVTNENLLAARWFGQNYLEDILVRGASQVIRAVLHSHHALEIPLPSSHYLLEFLDLQFGATPDFAREIFYDVRIAERLESTVRGTFLAYQGHGRTLLAGRLCATELQRPGPA
jgi:hypothetical protein